MTYEQINYEIQAGVATITLNRPDRMNALTRVLETETRDAMMRAGQDDAVRVIVLTGAGRAFCAGMDMEELETLPADDILDPARMLPFNMSARADYQGRYNYFPSVPKPIIASINGAAAGLGMIFALYADFRIASTKAVFTTAFAKRGLIAEHGSAWIIPHVVGYPTAIDLLMTSRKVLAEEALRIGLVSALHEPEALEDATNQMATTLASDVSPRSLRVMKRQLWDAPYQTLAEAVSVANHEMVKSINSEDFKEGVAHFIEKRPAKFTGR